MPFCRIESRESRWGGGGGAGPKEAVVHARAGLIPRLAMALGEDRRLGEKLFRMELVLGGF